MIGENVSANNITGCVYVCVSYDTMHLASILPSTWSPLNSLNDAVTSKPRNKSGYRPRSIWKFWTVYVPAGTGHVPGKSLDANNWRNMNGSRLDGEHTSISILFTILTYGKSGETFTKICFENWDTWFSIKWRFRVANFQEFTLTFVPGCTWSAIWNCTLAWSTRSETRLYSSPSTVTKFGTDGSWANSKWTFSTARQLSEQMISIMAMEMETVQMILFIINKWNCLAVQWFSNIYILRFGSG